MVVFPPQVAEMEHHLLEMSTELKFIAAERDAQASLLSVFKCTDDTADMKHDTIR